MNLASIAAKFREIASNRWYGPDDGPVEVDTLEYQSIGKMLKLATEKGAFDDHPRIEAALALVFQGPQQRWTTAAISALENEIFQDPIGLLPEEYMTNATGVKAYEDTLINFAIFFEMISNTKRKGNKRRSRERSPTEPQLEALKVVGECEGNFAKAARVMNVDPKTVRQHYYAGLRNAGKLASKLTRKPKLQPMPTDYREQSTIASDDDGPLPAKGQRKIYRRNRG